MHVHFIKEIAPAEAFKQLKQDIDKQSKTATKTHLQWINNFSQVLILELTRSTDCIFDL